MEMQVDSNHAVEELLDDLEYAAKTPAKQRVAKISVQVDKFCSAAFEDGLSSVSLNRVIDIITLPNELDQASINNLIKNIYPSSKIPDPIVIKVISSLGHGRYKPSYSAQAALVKWLVMVYDVLENQKILSQVYPILFNLLDTVAVRPPLCHILSLITRRKHVRPYRIQILMELTRQAGNEPPLVGLMRVFKDYYPDIIVGDTTVGRASVFTHPNPEWQIRLGEIQAAHYQRAQDGLPSEQRAFRVTRRSANKQKISQNSVIPEVRTLNAQESSVTLEEIEDVHDFIQRLEKIEPPNQLVAVLGDPLLQKFLQLRSSEVYTKRVDSWLLTFFEDQLQMTGPDNKILEMLEAVLGYTRYTKILPPACFTYLRSMIPNWNGITGRQVILDLLTYTRIGPFEDLHTSTFQWLEDVELDDSIIASKTELLSFYTNLLTNWATSPLTNPHPPSIITSSVTSLVNHANLLSTTILQISSDVQSLSTVLTFYETLTHLFAYPPLQSTLHISIPPAELIYTIHFTQSLNLLSRLCSILGLYKRAFENAVATNTSSYTKEYLNRFNGYLMDICNCIWRARAFNPSDVNALSCLQSPELISSLENYTKSLSNNLNLASLFSLSSSPVLCLLAIQYVRELEDEKENEIVSRHPGPVTQASLKQLEKDGGVRLSWGDYRLGVLVHLEGKGVNGVGELMYNTMKQLMSVRGKRG
ncbi:Mis6-domain-containing protein [Tricladium varicosporioides]|nr:Mis6-domain-containing protein [Hymenoscyphus varicosporioides]